jgi:Na+(H+)/acetate symporter ActP
VERIKQMPGLGSLITIIDRYPRISAWVVLSVGIVAILIYEARDVGLTFTNWVALIVASVVVAGLCIWIVSWEDEDEQASEKAESKEAVKGKSEAAPQAPGEASETAHPASIDSQPEEAEPKA